MVLLSVILVAQYDVSRTSQNNLIRIQLRESVSHQSGQIRLGVLTAMDILTDHLLNPQDETALQWQTEITAVLEHLHMIKKSGWGTQTNTGKLIENIERNIILLDVKALRLIQMRRVAEQTNPALFYARETMLPIQSSVITDLNQMMEELLEEENDATYPYYKKVAEAQHYWLQIIAAFRLYVINRLGSFDDSVLETQAQDLVLLYEGTLPMFQELTELANQDKLGLTGSMVGGQLTEQVEAWFRDFQSVRKLYTSKQWRNDIIVKNEQLRPLINTIVDQLQEMENHIEASANRDLQFLEKMADENVKQLWYLFGIVLMIFTLGYIYFKRSILNPIEQVSNALLDEARGDIAPQITHGKTRESQVLIDAFSEMRQKVSNRQNALEHQALHDALTGLPNRVLLNDRLKQCILTSRREQNSTALLLMDLDHFKEINDTLGHQVGDDILVAIGKRLTDLLRISDTVARLGGDEFAIIIPSSDSTHAENVANKILSALSQPYNVGGHKLYIGASIGIAMYPLHGDTETELTQRADIAMYTAKREGGGFSVYDAEQDDTSLGKLELATDLRVALQDKTLEMYYQPKIMPDKMQVNGAEALLRWNHPKHGFISPEQIISLAEHTGLIRPLTNWIIEQSIEQCARWQTMHYGISVSINLSVHNLMDYELVTVIKQALDRSGLKPGNLIIEITENVMITDPERAENTLNQLSGMGVSISIDDFGTGFSSLAYLKKLPVDELKIDKSFVIGMQSNENDNVIVKSTIDLARNLGLNVTAEGVENIWTQNQLLALGCNTIQGYYISRPIPVAEFEAWYASWKNKHTSEQVG